MTDEYRIIFQSDPTPDQTHGLRTVDNLKASTIEQLIAESKLIKQKISDVVANRKRAYEIARNSLLFLRRRQTFITSLIRMKKGPGYKW
jgi:hypothetical protein